MAELRKIVEAALFMAPGAVSLKELSRVSNTSMAEVRVALNELSHDYDAHDSALEIRDGEEGFRMAVRREYEGSVGHMASAPEFHKGIMKTLAYIAYKQPVVQAEVIGYRNSKAYEHIRLLKEKGFIRKERTGRTYKIYTTKKFVEYFGKGGKGEAAASAEISGTGAPAPVQRNEQHAETESQAEQ
ncbi:MAG: SMC-Scp complex subunit ScpB [Candidatus Diapherotrites archaeon]